MQASYKPRILQLARVAQRVPLLTSLIRTCWVRVLMFRKAPIVVERNGSPSPAGEHAPTQELHGTPLLGSGVLRLDGREG